MLDMCCCCISVDQLFMSVKSAEENADEIYNFKHGIMKAIIDIYVESK